MDEKKTVLIVEDEKSIVDILRFNLEKEGYAALTAYDGEAGLDQALKENPDLILLDVMLPKMPHSAGEGQQRPGDHPHRPGGGGGQGPGP